jgi:phage terminase small subunit
MDIDKIIESFKDKDILPVSVFAQNLEIIRHNLEIIEASKSQIKKDSLEKNVAYGFHIVNTYIVAHPGVKIIEASEKLIMSCFRQFGVKPEISKKEIMTPLMKLQKNMRADRNQ